jgi:predicted ATPase
MLPELGRPHRPERPEPAPEGGAAQARVLELLLDLFGRLSRDAPLVLVIEDLHWADRASRDLVAFMARRCATNGYCWRHTYRTDELVHPSSATPVAGRARPQQSSRTHRSMLFDRAELCLQLGAILDAPAPAELVDEILARSDGQSVSLPKSLLAQLASRRARGLLPGSLRDTLLTRDRAAVRPPAKAVLAAAAASRRRVDTGCWRR